MNNIARLIFEDSHDPLHHLATLEALWRSIDEGLAPDTLVLRRLSPCVLIGSSQEAAREVNLGECRRRHLPLLRRPSEGGAIYCDSDCLVFSFVCKHCSTTTTPENEALEHWGGVIARSFHRLGIAPESCFISRNDVAVGGKKVAGLTLTDWYGIRAFSGALLIDVDFETMGALLTPSPEKLGRHGAAGIQERLTSLRRCLTPDLSSKTVAMSLIESIASECGLSYAPNRFSNRELDLAEALKKQKYSKSAWNISLPDQEAS